MAIVQNGLNAQHARMLTDRAILDKHAPELRTRLSGILDAIESKSRKCESQLEFVFNPGTIDSLLIDALKLRGFHLEYPEVYDMSKHFNITVTW